MNRALRVAWPALTVLTALAALLAALAVGGGAAGVPGDDPGAVVLVGQPVAQLILDLAASVALGALLIAATASHPAEPRWNRLLDAAAAAAAVWTVAAGVFTFLLYLNFGPPIGSAEFGPNLSIFLTGTGSVWLAATLSAAVLTVLAIAVRSHTGAAVLVLAAIAALVPIALQGHAANAPGDHDTAISAFGLHIIGAAAWLGGLAVVLVLGRGMRGRPLADLAARYSSIALACFVVVAYSGVVSAVIRLGSLPALLSPYGQLILVKSAALIAAGALGAVHRVGTIPRIAQGSGRAPFLRLVGVELLVLGVASGFAAGLAAAPPPDQVIPPTTTPAQVLTGLPLPPPFTVGVLLTQWRSDPLWLLACGFSAALYLVGVRRLRRRGEAWPVGRTVRWLAGVVLLFWITNGALNRYEQVLFSAQVLVCAVLALVVPLLLVPGAPLTLLRRAVEPRQDGTRGAREWLAVLAPPRLVAVLTRPVVAAVLLGGSLVVLAGSPLLRWAVTDQVGHEWRAVQLLLVGVVFTRAMVRPSSPALRLVVLAAWSILLAGAGVALALGGGLLLSDWYGAMGWGTSALADQRAGAVGVWVVGALSTAGIAATAASGRRSPGLQRNRITGPPAAVPVGGLDRGRA